MAGLIGSAFFISYAVGHLLGGIAGDRIPIKMFMCIGLFGTSFCNLLVGFFPVYGVILTVWTTNGLFLSTLWGPIVRAIAMWYPPEGRGRPAVIVSFSSLAGYLISWAGLGLLAHYAWFLAKMNDNPGQLGLEDFSKPCGDGESGGSPPTSVWMLIRRHRLLWFCIAAMAQGVIKDGITLWEPTILTQPLFQWPLPVSRCLAL